MKSNTENVLASPIGYPETDFVGVFTRHKRSLEGTQICWFDVPAEQSLDVFAVKEMPEDHLVTSLIFHGEN